MGQVPSGKPDEGREWMLRFQAGDEEAFHHLFLHYKGLIYHLIFRYFNDTDLAEELTQETFVRVYQFKEKYKPQAQFSTWLYSIAVHLCLNTLRSRKKETPLHTDLNDKDEPITQYEDTTTPGPEEAFRQSEVGEAVARALQCLTEGQRALVLLTYFEDLSITEAARVLGVSDVGARLRLLRARAVLRKNLRNV